MDATEVLLFQQLIFFTFSFLVGAVISRIAWKRGFYRLPQEIAPNESAGFKSELSVRQVIEAFLIFFSIQMLVVPSLYYLWEAWQQGLPFFSSDVQLDQMGRTWINVWGALFTAIFLMLFARVLPTAQQREIFGIQGTKARAKTKLCHYLYGAATWFVVYPFVVALGQLIEIGIGALYTGGHADQLAVKHLKGVIDTPVIFWIMAASAVFVIPLLEEIVFRGALQGWLKPKMGTSRALILTSIVFSLFHFSPEQKLENVELLASLFLLSCYLGFLKEKKQSLWASIGLHSTFNGFSVLILYTS